MLYGPPVMARCWTDLMEKVVEVAALAASAMQKYAGRLFDDWSGEHWLF